MAPVCSHVFNRLAPVEVGEHMTTPKKRPATLGELKKSGYENGSLRQELRRNLVRKMEQGEELFPGIVGYEDTVIPQVENAILSGQDIILLGERGQAKSRLIRSLTRLLDDVVPIIRGSEVNDHPLAPISRYGKDMVESNGDDTEIDWLTAEERYAEKLATPDISIADLVGDIDPIRVAEGRYLSDELTIHYGLIPRTNRGIFCINELPDLAERIQVGLFNLMEERDIQIKGYLVRMPLDILVVASANPEDYTNRGRIITPLKDRYGAQIRTHYPKTLEEEIRIMESEYKRFPETEDRLFVPNFIKEIIAEFTAVARKSPEVNQRSGVSVRVSIANYETVLANALRRAIRLHEQMGVPRASDLPAMVASTTGKIELEGVEDTRENRLFEDLLKRAVMSVFERYFNPREFESLVARFEEGRAMETGVDVPGAEYVQRLSELDGFAEGLSRLGVGESEGAVASGMEFILEGLHLNRRLNRDKVEGRYRYRS
jgi:magnesium chelatase subunit I